MLHYSYMNKRYLVLGATGLGLGLAATIAYVTLRNQPDATPVTQETVQKPSFAELTDAQKQTWLADDHFNYQTKASIGEIADFYRSTYSNLSERTVLTQETAESLNLVLDGDPNGALVIQAVQLDESTRNVNVRYEDI